MMRLHLSTLTARWPADTMPAMARYESRTRRFSRAEYERLIDLGVFEPGEEIELIGGQLMVAEPQSAAHYTAIVKTARALEAAFGAGWYVRREGPIGLDDDSEPEPDRVGFLSHALPTPSSPRSPTRGSCASRAAWPGPARAAASA